MDAWTVAIDLLTISIILNIFIICGNRQKDRELQEYQHRAHMAESRLGWMERQMQEMMDEVYNKEMRREYEGDDEENLVQDDSDEFPESQDDDDCIRN